jgi:hypothetical protein
MKSDMISVPATLMKKIVIPHIATGLAWQMSRFDRDSVPKVAYPVRLHSILVGLPIYLAL